MDPLPKPQDNTTLFTAMFGAAVAGATTATVTYPLEYLKTLSQLENKAITTRAAIVPYDSMKPIFTGCSSLAFGMALKGCGRLWIFNQLQKFMAEKDGTTAGPRVVVAGLLTGSLETALIIPFENIKVRMIESSMISYGWKTKFDEPAKETVINKRKLSTNKQLPPGTAAKKTPGLVRNARLNALLHYHAHPSRTLFTMLKEVYETSGPLGFFRGSFLTIIRQTLNSVVWYTTYSFMQQLIDPSRDSITELELVGMGFASSLAVVGVTQPLDVIKTRIQSRDGILIYKNVMNCIATTFFNEGWSALWSGAAPRFVKISCSSTVTLLVYEWVTKAAEKLSDAKPFAA